MSAFQILIWLLHCLGIHTIARPSTDTKMWQTAWQISWWHYWSEELGPGYHVFYNLTSFLCSLIWNSSYKLLDCRWFCVSLCPKEINLLINNLNCMYQTGKNRSHERYYTNSRIRVWFNSATGCRSYWPNKSNGGDCCMFCYRYGSLGNREHRNKGKVIN